jgi:hydrogenase maturation protease
VKLLVAGIGNIFFGDDGFGCEVARALAAEPAPAGVTVDDFGIRGMHLAYELLAGYDRAFLIDAVPRGGAPGTLYVIEPQLAASGAPADAHRMDLENVFAFVRTLGGTPPPITLVGCEPSAVDEEMGLSEPVRRAVRPAAALVQRLLRDTFAAHEAATRSTTWTEV